MDNSGTNCKVFSFDLNAEVDRYFDESSIPKKGPPEMVVLLGGVASGKTTLRRERYSAGYVLVDAADIFISLSRGGYYDFPDAFLEPMDLMGRLIANRAISERRNIVTEIIGSDFDETTELIEAIRSAGYKIQAVGVTCDVEEAMKRNLSRGDDNISSYYAEPFQRQWLIDAAQGAANPSEDK